MTENNSRHFALEQLARTQEFFPRVENKASFLFVLNLGLLLTIGLNFPIAEAFSFAGGAGAAAACLVAVSLAHIFAAYFPSLESRRPSLLYFGDIAKMDCDAFVRDLGAASDEEIARQGLEQVWRNSELLRLKYARVGWAFRLTGASIPLWFAYLVAVTVEAGKLPTLGT